MSTDFDPSPRASKRRKTARYGSERTTLVENGALPQNDVAGEDSCSTASDGNEQSHPAEKSQLAAAPSSENNHSTRSSRTNLHQHSLVETSNSDDEAISTPSKRIRTIKTPGSDGKRKIKSLPSSNVDAGVADIEAERAGTPTSQQVTRSSGRVRKTPRRLDDVVQSPASKKRTRQSTAVNTIQEPGSVTPQLKSILSPSKKQKTHPRKSVIFDQQEKAIEDQLGFRDINTPLKSSTRKATPYPKRIGQAMHKGRLAEQIEGVSTTETEYSGDSNSDDIVMDEQFAVDIPLPHSTFNLPVPTPLAILEQRTYSSDVKSSVMSRLTSKTLPSKVPTHLLPQYTQLHTLLKATIASSESNSLLLLGPRGSGKSTLISLALQDITHTYASDFHTVTLSGFLQTDDRLALREIWRQLGHSRALDEAETEDIGASYADTMSSLLSLLSHPDEMLVDGGEHGLENATSSHRTTKSIVFILNEFDLFTTHPRQTLLYNLFDIAQSRKAPIAVVGCSTRMDVIECLEKRVKSRFSHRWLLVPTPKNIAEWDECVCDALLARAENAINSGLKKQDDDASQWNAFMKDTFLPSLHVQRLIRSQFYTTKSLPDAFVELLPLIAALDIPASKSSNSLSLSATNIQRPPSILHTVPKVPTLHLSLLLSSCRLTTIHHLPTPNFNLVHAHYAELVASTRLKQTAGGSVAASGSLRIWSRETCRGAWEELGTWGLLIPVTGGDDSGGRGEGETDTRMWRAEVGLEDVEWAVRQKFELDRAGQAAGGAGEVLLKWCREV